MGDVAISITIIPKGPEVNLEKLKNKIKSKIAVKDLKEDDIGFGLKFLKIMVVRPDAAGQGTDNIEKKLLEIPEVESVRIDDVTLI